MQAKAIIFGGYWIHNVVLKLVKYYNIIINIYIYIYMYKHYKQMLIIISIYIFI